MKARILKPSMTPEENARQQELFSVVESVRNLRPRAFDLATDHEADIKERWSAFDELYEAVRARLREKGLSPDDALTTPMPNLPQNLPPLTEDQSDRSRRIAVAMLFLVAKYGHPERTINEIMIQAETLVPTPPDPDTGAAMLTIKDQALLSELTHLARTEMTEDWECFYQCDSEPAAKRKLAFRRMYAAIGKTWMEESLFARSKTPEQRQKLIIFAFMCHVPGDQWGAKDLEELYADLLPIEEPDWDDQALFGP